VVWWISRYSLSAVQDGLSELDRVAGRLLLLVLDDVAEPEDLPDSRTGVHILVTTRLGHWPGRSAQIPVPAGDRDLSVALLRRKRPDIDAADADRLAGELHDLPSAVAQAATVLAGTGGGVDDYLRRLDDGPRPELLPALDQLRDESPGGYRLLKILAVLAPDIRLDLVFQVGTVGLLESVAPGASEPIRLAALLQRISRYGLLTIDQMERLVRVPRQVQRAVQGWMTSTDLDRTRHDAHRLLAAARPAADVDDPASWPALRDLWTHLEPSDAVDCPNDLVRSLIVDRVRYLRRFEDPHRARVLALDADRRWADTPRPKEPTVSRQRLRLGLEVGALLRDEDNPEEALAHDRRLLATIGDELGSDHPHTLAGRDAVAAGLRATGRYRDALTAAGAAYRAWSAVVGPEHPATLTSLSAVAAAHRMLGRARIAMDTARVVHSTSLAVRGPEHPDTLIAAADLARDLADAGDTGAAVAMLRDVVADLTRLTGARSPVTRDVTTDLAVALRLDGQPDAALALPDARGTGPTRRAHRFARAAALLAGEEPEQAERIFEEVRAAGAERLGERHPHMLYTLHNLAVCARARSDLRTAAGLAAAGEAGLADVLGPEHPARLIALATRAVIGWEAGDRGVTAWIDEAGSGLREAYGDDHPDTLTVAANAALARLLTVDDGAFPEAVARLARRVGTGHAAILTLQERRFVVRPLDLPR
jgi:hypothetical protein